MRAKTDILVGVDGCPHSDAALTWAADEAASRGVGLMVVHALDMNALGLWMTTSSIRDSLREVAQPIVDHALELVAERQPGVAARGRVLIGSPTRTLLFLSARAAMTVVGRSGNGALSRLRLGSVTQRALAHASSPAVAVSDRPGPRDTRPISRIVVGMNDGPAEPAALRFAFEEATRRHVPLEALHVMALESHRRPGPDDLLAEERQAKVLAGFEADNPDVDVTSSIRVGRAGAVLAAVCGRDDLLVLGHHRHTQFSPHQLGRVASAALYEAPCAVCVVHEPTENVYL